MDVVEEILKALANMLGKKGLIKRALRVPVVSGMIVD